MSHSMLLVVGDDIEEQLAPFNGELEVERYMSESREEIIARARKNREEFKAGAYAEYLKDPEKYISECVNPHHGAYITEQFPLILEMSDDELHEYETRLFEEKDIDEHGNVYSTYNPKSKWDWWSIGGRWENALISTDGEAVDGNQGAKGQMTLKGEPSFAVLKDGVWYERGDMGWWGMVKEEKSAEEWKAEFQKIWDSIPDGELLTVVDIHI